MRAGLDLRLLGSSLSYRRLGVFLGASPMSSAFARAYLGEAAQWTRTDAILADLYDLTIDCHQWKKPPQRYPRPQTKKACTRKYKSIEEVREITRKRRARWQLS